MPTRRPLVPAGLLLACVAVAAPDPEPPTLPADVIPATFRMFIVSDKRFEPLKDAEGKFLKGPGGKEVPNPKNREGKIHCLVCEYGLNPVVAVFVRASAKQVGPADGLGKLIKGLDALIPKYRADKLAAFVAFLNLEGGTKTVTIKQKRADGSEFEEKVEQDLEYPDDEKRDVYAEEVRDAVNGLEVRNVPFGLAPDKSKSVTAWGVKDTDEVTVIFYNRMRQVGTPWRFARIADLTDEKKDEILRAVQNALSGRR